MKSIRYFVSCSIFAAVLVGCSKQPPQADASKPGGVLVPAPIQQAELDGDPTAQLLEQGEPLDPHTIVFSDRTSQGYLLLLDEGHNEQPSREQLQALVRGKLAAKVDEPEVKLLLRLVGLEPKTTFADDTRRGAPRATQDLLGFYIEVMPLASVLDPRVLADPVLTRELDDTQRAALDSRTHVLLLRADYRNQYAVRGLRLLQTIVRIVAEQRGALIFDPDTEETMGLDAFARRRLRSSLGNIADQVVVVPFPDKLHEGKVRLSTRGMRRFGSVDLELDGLPRDAQVLQRATDLLYGLCYKMMRVGEFDARGYAVELGDTVNVARSDVRRAYGGRGKKLVACEECEDEVEVHLVERAAEEHDPMNHITARVVAPRPVSDGEAYDQGRWAIGIVRQLLGSSR